MKNSKKIVILGMILLIVAGIIVVALKGFNVDLMFGKHETIEVKIGKEVNIDDVNQMCSEVFANKKYVVKDLELFNDSFQINVESITDEEKENLVAIINEKYEVEKTVENLNVFSVSNRRIRDSIKPYISSMIIVFAIVYVYMLIRFRKLNSKKLVVNSIFKIILTEAVALSIIAITRIEVSDLYINLLMIIAVFELIIFLMNSEKKLEKIEE